MDRNKVIIRTSIVGIVANVLLASFKALVGLAVHSTAMVLDAVNNFKDLERVLCHNARRVDREITEQSTSDHVDMTDGFDLRDLWEVREFGIVGGEKTVQE
jgi:predicted Co/Zn/Cd cation transporter (cation efflux family)